MKCGDCKHYDPARNPETGLQLPSQDGNCTYSVEWPELPKSYLPDRWDRYGSMRHIIYPQRRKVWKNDDENCAMFVAKTSKKPDQIDLDVRSEP